MGPVGTQPLSPPFTIGVYIINSDGPCSKFHNESKATAVDEALLPWNVGLQDVDY